MFRPRGIRKKHAALVIVGLVLALGGAFGEFAAAPGTIVDEVHTLPGTHYASVSLLGKAGGTLSGRFVVLEGGEITVWVTIDQPYSGFPGSGDSGALFQATGRDLNFSIVLPRDGLIFVRIFGDSEHWSSQQTFRALVVRSWWVGELVLGAALPLGAGAFLVARGLLGHRAVLRRDEAAFFVGPGAPPPPGSPPA